MTRDSIAGLAAGALLLLVLMPVRAADEPPGILWQTTSQMVMEGMPFSPPPQTLKVCSHRTWTRPPPGGDPSCRVTNYQVVGNKATWAVACAGDMPMTGVGEMTWNGTDSYSGKIKFMAEGMNMTVNLTGTRIGTCDNPQ